jgi:hypothetical protein
VDLRESVANELDGAVGRSVVDQPDLQVEGARRVVDRVEAGAYQLTAPVGDDDDVEIGQSRRSS